MVDSLKTFNEGEYIYASETNSNNQYLLSKLSDNAAQVQTYVEGEISSIQSNVASVQATLQGNIDNVSNNLNTFSTEIFTKITPNYAAAVSISSGYVAPKFGQVYVQFNAGPEATAYVDGKKVAWHNRSVNYKQACGSCFLVGKGQKVTAVEYSTLIFYPCKGGI